MARRRPTLSGYHLPDRAGLVGLVGLRLAVAMAVEISTVAFCWSAGPAVAGERRRGKVAGRSRRTVVDDALGSHRGADPLLDDPNYLQNAVTMIDPCLYSIAHLDLGGGLGRFAIHANVAAVAGVGCRGTSLVKPNRPHPAIDPSRVHRVIFSRVARMGGRSGGMERCATRPSETTASAWGSS